MDRVPNHEQTTTHGAQRGAKPLILFGQARAHQINDNCNCPQKHKEKPALEMPAPPAGHRTPVWLTRSNGFSAVSADVWLLDFVITHKSLLFLLNESTALHTPAKVNRKIFVSHAPARHSEAGS